MILDQNLKLATDLSIAGSLTNLVATDVVDLSTIRDIGAGYGLTVHFRCKETPVRNAAGAYFQFAAIVASDAALSTNAIVIAASPPWGNPIHAGGQLPQFDTSVGVGEKSDTTRFKMPLGTFPASAAVLYNRRYFGVIYVNPILAFGPTLYFTAGKFDIDLGFDFDDASPVYGKSYTIV